MRNTISRSLRHGLLAGAAVCLSLASTIAQAQVPYVSATVSGQLQPGIYGRIDIGNAPPPPLIYAQPIIIHRPAVYVQQPLYLHVPPGHAKKWSKHCYKYDACGRQVYFVRVNGDDEYGRDSHKGKDYERRRERSKEDYERGRERSKEDYERRRERNKAD